MTIKPPRIEHLGEAALILRDLPVSAPRAAALLAQAGIGAEDIVPAFDSVGIYFPNPEAVPDSERILTALSTESKQTWDPKSHDIPVCYELGEDLGFVAEQLGLETSQIAQAHSAVQYVCRAIGFCPGFPYLERLGAELRGLARRPSPRVRVEPGSIAVTRDMTGIYPLARPGGWWIIGRTPLFIVDPGTDYFPIRVGDSVRFQPISAAEFERRRGERL